MITKHMMIVMILTTPFIVGADKKPGNEQHTVTLHGLKQPQSKKPVVIHDQPIHTEYEKGLHLIVQRVKEFSAQTQAQPSGYCD
ncbi:MAG: hypothetical protein ACHQVS_00250 [Candidatus Babeliales bacterium]